MGDNNDNNCINIEEYDGDDKTENVNRNDSGTMDDSWGVASYSHVNAGYTCKMSYDTSEMI